jgi:serine phosphatase RsbU (regulator of sigma subunit)
MVDEHQDDLPSRLLAHEARRHGGELFGAERLDAILRESDGLREPETVIANVNARLTDFTGGRPMNDDRTLLVALGI